VSDDSIRDPEPSCYEKIVYAECDAQRPLKNSSESQTSRESKGDRQSAETKAFAHRLSATPTS